MNSVGVQGALLIQDAKILLQSISHWSVRHVPRAANLAAHVLGRETYLYNVESFELESIPHCIKDIVTLMLS